MSYLDKCTKGEWVAEYDGDYETSILVRGEENFCLASVHGCNVEEINSAHLMAASKKMYEALDELKSMLSTLMENSNIRMIIHDDDEYDEAIEKANLALKAARVEK